MQRIEGSNIEYGNIEKCSIDSDLRSKNLRLVISKKVTVTSNLTSKTATLTLKRGQTGSLVGSNGVIASPIIISSHPPTPRGTPFDVDRDRFSD